jgi:hypothetical protein
MTVHLSVRLPWHDSGWNGCICQYPKLNTYCGGLYSVNAETIRQNKDNDWEEEHAGEPIAGLDHLPPCAQHINTFGNQTFTFIHQPRDFLKAGGPYPEQFAPTCFGTWAYDNMYDPLAGRREAEVAETKVIETFEQLDKNQSLIFFYLNYSNPISPEENKYVLAGVSRYLDKGELMRWSGMPLDRQEKYGDLVWSRKIRHSYPEECFIIPYQAYIQKGKDLSNITLTIEGEMARRFKYVSRPLTDGDAAELVSEMLRIARQLQKDKVTKEDWKTKIEWLDKLLDDCWQQRGLFPGLAGVLGYLTFANANDYIRNILRGVANPYQHVFDRLEGKITPEKAWQLSFQSAKDRWASRPSPIKELLKDKLCLFELTAEQIEHILGEKHTSYGIASTPHEMQENPYLITEEYKSGTPDDSIALHQIDQGMMPSTKLEASWRIKPNDKRRIRAALREILIEAGESGHMVKMRNRNLLTNIPNSLPNICADEQRLTQIILNLVDNSIKYSTEKAAITISVRQDTNLDNILFQVTDTGFGIPPDKQIEIFNPYARIRKAEEHTTGLGIGLSLSRTLVELHGGQIWFETSEGIGSSFYFTIPKYTRKHMTTAFKKGQPDENCHN